MAKIKKTKSESIKSESIRTVSIEKMIDENRKAVHTSDYQTYLRKLMREAAGKF